MGEGDPSIALGSDVLELDAGPPPVPVRAGRAADIPYAFARKFGVVLLEDEARTLTDDELEALPRRTPLA